MVVLAHTKFPKGDKRTMAQKTLKARTEELLLNCLKENEWFDTALYSYSNQLLDMTVDTPRSGKELEALTRLVSQYALYLDPIYCSEDFEWTEREKLDELSDIKLTLSFNLSERFPNVPFTSYLRIKTLESFMEKVWRKGSTPSKAEDDLKDLVAFRFVLSGRTPDEFVQECYLFFELIVSYLDEFGFKPVPSAVKGTKGFDRTLFNEYIYIPDSIPENCFYIQKGKDYIRNPKTNGYQGLQISLYSPQRGMYIEVQVKTQIMLENSEYFESAHITYKGEGGLAEVGEKLFDGKDLRDFNCLHGFHSRDGEKFVDYLGILTPRFL